MICPLMSRPKQIDINNRIADLPHKPEDAYFVDCQEGNCAAWDKKEGQCDYLRGYRYGQQEVHNSY